MHLFWIFFKKIYSFNEIFERDFIMTKHLTVLLFIGLIFWGCEECDDSLTNELMEFPSIVNTSNEPKIGNGYTDLGYTNKVGSLYVS